jgi:hypothetical protein
MVLIQLIDLACLPITPPEFPGYSGISLNKDRFRLFLKFAFADTIPAVTVEVKLYGFQLPKPFAYFHLIRICKVKR